MRIFRMQTLQKNFQDRLRDLAKNEIGLLHIVLIQNIHV